MKKLFLYSLALMATAFLNLCAAPINSYQKLTSAMLEGKQFVFIIDLAQCSGMPNRLIYFIPTNMTLVPATNTTQEYVIVSQTQLLEWSGDNKIFYQFYKYYIYLDNTVKFQFASYYPNSFEQASEPLTYITSLNKGIYVKTLDEAEKDDVIPLN